MYAQQIFSNSISINGKSVRKGSIAAFLANADILENCNAIIQQKHGAISMMIELAPALIAIGLHKHIEFKNPQVEQILVKVENLTQGENIVVISGAD